jgi:nicotinamide-nucleotide amidase
MNVEILNTGTELLLGQVINSHLAFFGQELFELGLRIDRQTAVPDGKAVRAALAEALERAELVVVTGGLGPTSDDITRDAAADLLGRKLVLQPEILETIRARFDRRGLPMPESNRVQALVPEGALVLPNGQGTAPGLLLEEKGKVVVLLPGPPRELKPMWTETVVPWLKTRYGALPRLHQKTWRTMGMGESRLQELVEEEVRKLGDVEIGYCARPNEVDFRLLSTDPALLEQAAPVVDRLLGGHVYARTLESLESVVVGLARRRGWKIATAESCTGGEIAGRLTDVPGSSAVFEFGWVTYADAVKVRELGVPAALIAEHGAVSEAVVKAMAEGARSASGADVAVAASGIAGPEGGTPEKPVGTCWLAVASAFGVRAVNKRFSADRPGFKHLASQEALELVRQELLK